MTTLSQRPGKRGKQQQSSHAGHRVSGSGKEQHPIASSAMSSANLPGVYSNPEMAYALVGIVGCIVDVQLQNGVAYQGVLKAVSPQLSVALALAHDKTREPSTENTEKLMQLEFADIVTVSVLPDSNPSLNSKDIFKTDAEISRANGSGLSRELQPFTFDEDSNTITLVDGTGTGWSAEDMFETNKSKFQVGSSYDEEMTEYTIKLDRTETKDFHQRQERAARLAREIEINPDRYKVDDDTGTEEELFSSVVRQQIAPPPSTVAPPPSSSSSVPKPLSKHTPPTQTTPPSGPTTTTPPSGPTTTTPPSGPTQTTHPSGPTQTTHPSGPTTTTPPSGTISDRPLENSIDVKAPVGGASEVDTSSSHSRIGTSSSSPSLTTSRDFQAKKTDTTRIISTKKKEEEEEPETVCENETPPPPPGLSESGVPIVTTGNGSQDNSSDEVDNMKMEHVKDDLEEVTGGVTPPTEGGAEAETEDGATMPPNMDTTTPTGSEAEIPDKDVIPRDKPRLDPNAKEFVPSFLPDTTSLLSQSSSSPAVMDSTHYRPPATSAHLTGKKFTKRTRNHTPMTFAPQEPVSYGGGGYMITQTPQLATVMRGPLQQVPSGQMIQYSTGIPQYAQPYPTVGGFIAPQNHALATPQHYVGDVTSQQQQQQQQVYASGQQFHINPQMIQQPHAQLGTQSQLSAATSPGLVATHQVVNPQMMLVQGHPVGGAGGSGPPVSVYPHMQVTGFIPQVGQNQVVTQNRYIYSNQQPPN